ncbi:MAG: hypothetical protein GC172_03505 [Phycisphaera sp.]|nr:hypothetical protein [Phycisphaera sp.]
MSKKRKVSASRRTAIKVGTEAQTAKARVAAPPASVCDDAAWHAVRSPLRLQVLEAIRACPGVDARTLSLALRTSAPRLYYHINILLESGLVSAHAPKALPASGAAPSSRRAGRGPEALVYRANGSGFPDGFFSRNDRCLEHRETLLRELVERGMSDAIASTSTGEAHLSVRRERLTQSEADRVRGLLRQVEDILDTARARRHGDGRVVPATHFVAVAMSGVNGSELPDGPLEPRNGVR